MLSDIGHARSGPVFLWGGQPRKQWQREYWTLAVIRTRLRPPVWVCVCVCVSEWVSECVVCYLWREWGLCCCAQMLFVLLKDVRYWQSSVGHRVTGPGAWYRRGKQHFTLTLLPLPLLVVDRLHRNDQLASFAMIYSTQRQARKVICEKSRSI